MSDAGNNFKNSIQDAENLLQHFDSLNKHPPEPGLEVLKRAGLIMAMTAWKRTWKIALRKPVPSA